MSPNIWAINVREKSSRKKVSTVRNRNERDATESQDRRTVKSKNWSTSLYFSPSISAISLSLFIACFVFLFGGDASEAYSPESGCEERSGETRRDSFLGGKTNLAKVEGLRARPWLKPEGFVNGGQYDYDGDEDDHSRPWWRRRLRSLYMAAMSFTSSTFRIVISLLLLVAIGAAFTFLPVEQAISFSLLPSWFAFRV